MRCIFYIIIVIPFIFQNCKKKENNFGTATLTFNGVARNFKVNGFEDELNNSNLFTYNAIYRENDLIQEVIATYNVPKRIGKFELFISRGSKSSLNWYNHTDDVLEGELKLDTTQTGNEIEVTEINKSCTKIKGHFAASMVVIYGNRYGDSGTKIKVTGTFDLHK